MAAKLDITEWSIVVWCRECPWYARIAYDEAHGHEMAIEHEDDVHPGSKAAFMNRMRYRRRVSFDL